MGEAEKLLSKALGDHQRTKKDLDAANSQLSQRERDLTQEKEDHKRSKDVLDQVKAQSKQREQDHTTQIDQVRAQILLLERQRQQQAYFLSILSAETAGNDLEKAQKRVELLREQVLYLLQELTLSNKHLSEFQELVRSLNSLNAEAFKRIAEQDEEAVKQQGKYAHLISETRILNADLGAARDDALASKRTKERTLIAFVVIIVFLAALFIIRHN